MKKIIKIEQFLCSQKNLPENMAKWYFSMFWGRDDVYAKRGSKGGYFPQCNNRWNVWIGSKRESESILTSYQCC